MSAQIHRLSNGMRIAVEPMSGLESASIGIWVSAGGRHERIEQNGIAHFLEHMAFKGTETRTSLQIAEAIEDVGGYINAYTTREVTAYYARVLRNDVGLALDVLADILLNPLFEDAEIETERGVILQEIGMSLDTPDDVIFDWLQEASYPDQPIGRTILGPAERVSSFTRADLAGFVAEQYGPENMILSASGAVDPDAIVAQAETLFGSLGSRKPQLAEGALFATGERREVKSLEQAHFTLSFEGPGYREDEFYTGQIFATLFGGGISSRLFQEIREKRGLCYSIYAQLGAYSDTGALTIYAGTSSEDIADLADITVDELKRSVTDITETEVARACAQMKAGLLMGLESPSSRAERQARLIGIWDRVPDLSETVAKIDAVDLAAVQKFAQDLTQAKRAMALYGPVEKARDLEAISRRLAA